METIYFQYKSIQIAYSKKGYGDPIILLHGFLENKSMWNDILPELTKSNKIITVDLLGHGETGSLEDIHSMEDMADAIFALILELELEKITLIGHSMGGYVSLAIGENYPDYVNKIILVTSTCQADTTKRKINRDRAITLVEKNSSLFISMAINNLFIEESRVSHQTEINRMILNAQKTTIQGIKAALAGMKIRPDRESLIYLASFPIYAIIGKYDTVITAKEVVAQFSSDNYLLLDSGHMPHIEERKGLIKALTYFIQKN